MRWGSKAVKGCKEVTCTNLHPSVCPASLDLMCTDQKCDYKIHVYKCRRRKSESSDRSSQTSGAGKGRLSQGKPGGKQPGSRKRKVSQTGTGRPKPSDQAKVSDQAKANASSSVCTCAAKAVSTAAPSHSCCQPCADQCHPRGGQSEPVSIQAGASQSGTGNCLSGHRCGDHLSADNQGFQLPTVQPVLEAWAESVKKDLLQRQDLMLQMLRMEMQARPPLGRGAYGLLPSF